MIGKFFKKPNRVFRLYKTGTKWSMSSTDYSGIYADVEAASLKQAYFFAYNNQWKSAAEFGIMLYHDVNNKPHERRWDDVVLKEVDNDYEIDEDADE